MDTAILAEIGLTAGEIKTYLALLKLGSASTGPLANEAQVSRSKLYAILDKLEKKGLAAHFEKNGVAYFQPADPSRIKSYLAEKAKKLGEMERDFDAFLPKLFSYQAEGSESAKVSVYQGLRGLSAAHEHMYLKLGKGDFYCAMGMPSTQPDEYNAFWEKDHARRSRAGIKAKLLFNRDVPREILRNRNSSPGCDARYMPLDLKTPASFDIYADTVLIIIPSGNPITIEIVSKEMADSFAAYFNEFWKKSRRLK